MKTWLCWLACAAGGSLASAAVVTYPAPREEVLSADYEVWAEGKKVDVYTARTLDPPFAGKQWDFGGLYSFANFDLAGAAEVRITSKRSLRDTVIRPATAGVKMRLEGDHTLLVSLPGPRKLSIEPEGKKGPLLLFANPLEETPPQPGAPGVIYFGPGVHEAGRMVVTNGQTLYLAGGAVVKGGVRAEGNDLRITGRGILDSSDYEWRKGPTPSVVTIRGTNVEVSGITIRGASHWTIVPRDSRRVTVRHVKLCGSRVQNDDGINPCNSQDVRITDCFIRTDDDCVALKGLESRGPQSNVERILVENCTLWCDRARIFLLGHESRAPFMRAITLRNLDIIHFSMTPFLFEPGEEMRLEDVTVADVRIHGEGQGELVRLKPVVNQYMRTKVPGHIAQVRFRNVTVAGKPGGYRVQLSGADEAHAVRGVSFENVSILGAPLAAGSERLQVGPHVHDARWGPPPVALLTEQQADGEFAGWKSFHETAGTRTAEVWRLQPDGVLVCRGRPRGYLYTEQEYTDFTLEFEWRHPAGATNSNGGVLVRMTGEHGIWPRSLEFQLNLGQAGDFWALRGYEFTGPAGRVQTMTNAAFGVLRHLRRQADAEKPAGEWNRFEGSVSGGTVVQKVNDVTVNEATGCEAVAGRILLTAEGQEIHFRNLRLAPKR